MIFLSAAEPGVTVNVFGADFHLEPIVFPDVDIGQILAMENELAKRILQRGDGKIQKIDFDSERLPGFPARLDPGGEIPAGYGSNWHLDLEPRAPVSVQPSSWGGIKALYR